MPEKTEEKATATITTTETPLPPVDQIVETKHEIVIGGRRIPYTVTAGTLSAPRGEREEGRSGGASEGHKPKAVVFFIAYTRRDAGDPARRPITFSFNGGPGSSSVWLHLGVLGPRRVDLGEDGFLPAPPFRLVDNEHTLLDADRPGLHRSGEHRLQPRRGRREGQGVPRPSSGTSSRSASSSASTHRATGAGCRPSS